ncbi:hypothetical protein HUU59_08515 [bacterium]|nr:hypothetical protein [bacterium]
MQKKKRPGTRRRKSLRLTFGPLPINLRAASRAFCLRFITEALRVHKGNISQTAIALGISRRSLQLKMKQYGLKADDF